MDERRVPYGLQRQTALNKDGPPAAVGADYPGMAPGIVNAKPYADGEGRAMILPDPVLSQRYGSPGVPEMLRVGNANGGELVIYERPGGVVGGCNRQIMTSGMINDVQHAGQVVNYNPSYARPIGGQFAGNQIVGSGGGRLVTNANRYQQFCPVGNVPFIPQAVSEPITIYNGNRKITSSTKPLPEDVNNMYLSLDLLQGIETDPKKFEYLEQIKRQMLAHGQYLNSNKDIASKTDAESTVPKMRRVLQNGKEYIHLSPYIDVEQAKIQVNNKEQIVISGVKCPQMEAVDPVGFLDTGNKRYLRWFMIFLILMTALVVLYIGYRVLSWLFCSDCGKCGNRRGKCHC